MRFLRPLVLTLAFAAATVPAFTQPALAQDGGNQQQNNQRNNQSNQQTDSRQQGQDTEGENIDPITGKKVGNSSVIDYVNSAYQFLAVIGGLLAVLMLVYAGYRYMTSYGDPENIKDAKDIVEKALIGLGLLILAALILNTINPRTAQDPCNPGEPGCGDIDFSRPDGGVQQNQNNNNGGNNNRNGGNNNQGGNSQGGNNNQGNN